MTILIVDLAGPSHVIMLNVLVVFLPLLPRGEQLRATLIVHVEIVVFLGGGIGGAVEVVNVDGDSLVLIVVEVVSVVKLVTIAS